MRTGLRALAASVAAALVLASPSQAAEAGNVLYKGMTLIDGAGAAPQPDMAIITEGERIAMVFPAQRLEIMRLRPMPVVEAKGLSAIPTPGSGGRIAEGEVADITFLRADPSKDKSALKQIAFTVRRGVRSAP